MSKTYSSKSNAKRAAKRQGLSVDNLTFSSNSEGRWSWAEAASTGSTKKATRSSAARKGRHLDPDYMPKPSVSEQGALKKRKVEGKPVLTKANKVRRLIAEHYDSEANNADECIRLIMKRMDFGRSLARTYFANNLPKVQAQAEADDS